MVKGLRCGKGSRARFAGSLFLKSLPRGFWVSEWVEGIGGTFNRLLSAAIVCTQIQ